MRGDGTWSESERALTSQKSSTVKSVYPDSIISHILGPRGSHLIALKEETGASMLMLRGAGLGDDKTIDDKKTTYSTRRVIRAPHRFAKF